MVRVSIPLNFVNLDNSMLFKFISYKSVFPSRAKLITNLSPLGENLGENVIPGKSPKTFCFPVSKSNKKILALFRNKISMLLIAMLGKTVV